MSEATLIALSPWGGIAFLVTWLVLHERRCADRWSKHMVEYGKLDGQVSQWLEDHRAGKRG